MDGRISGSGRVMCLLLQVIGLSESMVITWAPLLYYYIAILFCITNLRKKNLFNYK